MLRAAAGRDDVETTAHADRDSDFEAAFAAGVGLTSRWLVYRTLAGNMRTRLAEGERVADLAPTSDYSSLTEARRRSAAQPPGSIARLVPYLIAGFVLGAVLDVSLPVLIAVLSAASLVPEAWHSLRRRSRGERKRRRSMRSLVMVTDRRLIEGMHPNEFREVRLEHVKDVQVRTGNMGIATVRVSADTGDTDIHIISEWPKRTAVPAAEAIAEAIRRGSPVPRRP